MSSLIVLIFLILSGNSLICQDTTRQKENDVSGYYNVERNPWSAGLFSGTLLNNHFVDFHALPTIPSCCPEYKTGFGLGFTFGGLYDYKLSDEYGLSLELRAYYANLGGTLKADERELMYYSPTVSVEGLIEHTIETSIHTFLFDPMLKYRLFENFSVHLGMSFGIIASTFFRQKEELINPKDLTFENDQRVRMVYSGDIPNSTSIYTSITGGINYDIMLTNDNNWYLSPELFLSYGLNNIIKDEKWKELSVRLAVAVNYNGSTGLLKKFEQYRKIDTIQREVPAIAENMIVPGNPSVRYDTLKLDNILTIRENYYRVDTMMTKKVIIEPEYEFSAKLSTTALEDNGKEITNPDLKAEEFFATKMEPLLNYIFFDSNSYVIPERYHLLESYQTKDYSISKTFIEGDLGFYYNILNTVGMKMRQSPGAKLTLTGCNSNLGAEKNNLTLSKNRSQSIKDYLTKVWLIDENRIAVKARNLPAVPSNNNTQDGIEENRRVEIICDDLKVGSPVIANDKIINFTVTDLKDTVKKLNFGGFRFHSSVTPGIELRNWVLSVTQGKDTIKKFEGTGNIPNIQDWIFSQGKYSNETFLKPMMFNLKATDINNRVAIALDTPKIKIITLESKQNNNQPDIVYDTYSIMLFEYASSKLSDPEFPKLVSSNLSDKANLQVYGYSDRLGDDNFNMKLSTERAKAVADAIGHSNTIYKGFGESILLHNNNLPEGRFYSRNVDIYVETPVKW